MGSKIKCSHALVKKLSEAQEILDLVKNGEKFGMPSAKKDQLIQVAQSVMGI